MCYTLVFPETQAISYLNIVGYLWNVILLPLKFLPAAQNYSIIFRPIMIDISGAQKQRTLKNALEISTEVVCDVIFCPDGGYVEFLLDSNAFSRCF